MIRINLYGSPRPKKGGKRPAMTASLPVEGPSVLIIGVVMLGLALGGSYWWYFRLNKQHQELQTKLQTADARIKQLSIVKTKYEEKDKQAGVLKKRFDVIDQLRANQSGPVKLLDMLSETVSNSDAVWLNSMKDNGGQVELNGVALSNVALANLMSNLRKSGYFKSVELRETIQENVKSIQAFTFTLVCDKASEKKS